LRKKLVLKAKIAGADAVKFQTFSANKLVIPGTRKVKYQKKDSKYSQKKVDLRVNF